MSHSVAKGRRSQQSPRELGENTARLLAISMQTRPITSQPVELDCPYQMSQRRPLPPDARYVYGSYLTNGCAMKDRALYSVTEARDLLGGISRNSIYALLRSGELASVIIGCRRFISHEAISELIAKSTTTTSPAIDPTRFRKPDQNPLPLPLTPVAERVNDFETPVITRLESNRV